MATVPVLDEPAVNEPPGAPGTAQSSRPGSVAWLAIVAAVAAMMAVGFWGLDRGSVWQDEQATLGAAGRSIPQILAMIRHVDAVHALYYLMMHVWMLPGGGEVWMRVPSVLAASTAAGLVAALGCRLLNVATGLFAGLLFAVLPFVSFYAQEGRSYALVSAVVLAATYCLVRAVESDDPRWWWVGYAFASVIAIGLHEFAVLAVVAHAVTLLWSRVPGRVWRPWGIGAAVCAIAVTPLALVTRSQSGQVDWLTPPNWSTLERLAALLTGPRPAVMVVVGTLILVGLVWPRRGPNPLQLRTVAAPLLLVPPAALLGASSWQPLYHDRYVFFSVAGGALLAANGLDRIVAMVAPARKPRHLAAFVSVALVALMFVMQLPDQRAVRTVESRLNDLAGAARTVQQEARPGDGVIFLPSRYRAAALAYPKAFTGLDDLALARTPIEAANLRGQDRSRPDTRQAMLAADRIWVIGRPALQVRTNEAGAINERQVLRQYFTQVSRARVHGLEIALYTKKSPPATR